MQVHQTPNNQMTVLREFDKLKEFSSAFLGCHCFIICDRKIEHLFLHSILSDRKKQRMHVSDLACFMLGEQEYKIIELKPEILCDEIQDSDHPQNDSFEPSYGLSLSNLDGVLTPRELQIAKLVAAGSSNKEIAMRLNISKWTVSTHIRRIFSKLNVRSRAAMVYECASYFQKN